MYVCVCACVRVRVCGQEEKAATMKGDTGRRVREVHSSVERDVTTMFSGKTSSELAKLRVDIDSKIERATKLLDLHSGRKQEAQGTGPVAVTSWCLIL